MKLITCPTSIKVKTEWTYTSLYAIMACTGTVLLVSEGRLLYFLFALLLQLCLVAELVTSEKVTISCTVSDSTWKTLC